MDERTGKVLGMLSALGGVLAVVSSVPSRWYGVPETDAYVFDPATFSPLWVERTVVPVVAAAAAVLVLAGVCGLVIRDRTVAGRLRRWSGYAAFAGLSPFALVLLLDAVTAGALWTGSGGAGRAFVLLVALLVVILGLGLALPALAAMGIGYARTDRPTVGYALVTGLALAVLFFFGGWHADLGTVGALPVVVPSAAAFLVVGYDLWTRPEPLPERDVDESPSVSDDSTTADHASPAIPNDHSTTADEESPATRTRERGDE